MTSCLTVHVDDRIISHRLTRMRFSIANTSTRQQRGKIIRMTRHFIAGILCLAAAAAIAWSIGRTPDILFEKHALDLGANETCAVADINRDGKLDIISGENWYEGPRWTKNHFRTISYTEN